MCNDVPWPEIPDISDIPGAFDPANDHSVLHTDKYYEKVELLLDKAKTQKDAIQTLQKIQRMLENGTFFNANL